MFRGQRNLSARRAAREKENKMQDNKCAAVGDKTTKERKRKEVMREPLSPDSEETLG